LKLKIKNICGKFSDNPVNIHITKMRFFEPSGHMEKINKIILKITKINNEANNKR